MREGEREGGREGRGRERKRGGNTVCIKKNATNAPQWHLKTWRHVHHFFPPEAPHFDGRAAMRCL